MRSDEKGWWDVPALSDWICPKCERASSVDLWEQVEIGCEDCGSHDGRRCPLCSEEYDHCWGAEQLAAANK